MTAQFDSQDPRDPSQQASDDYENYVPEREFVLMPLFRRIGQHLGFGRSSAKEPSYAEIAPPQTMASEEMPVQPAPISPQQPAEAELAPMVQFDSDFEIPTDSRSEARLAKADVAQILKRSIVAPLREVSTKLSNRLSGAAQWLEPKIQTLLQHARPSEVGAEVSHNEPIPFPPVESSAYDEERQVEATEPLPETPAVAEIDEHLTVPALQREMAWEERSSEPHSPMLASEAKSIAPEPAPPPVATWWQYHIDWTRYLTSKRVALIGGLAMAALIMLGISLARRPAADMLPQQTATQGLEPGGVTLSTHPLLTTAHTPKQKAPIPSHSRTLKTDASADDGGPEVVTHYYRQKPSPVHQATVNGVHHYSDLN